MTSHDLPAEPTSYLPGQNRSKKRRVAPESAATSGEATARGDGTAGWRKAPEVILRGHTARVGGGMWDKEEVGRVWSTAWDGSVRGWDAENGYGDVLKQGPQDRAGLCIDQLSGSGTLITGNMDRTICLWDTREGESDLVSVLYRCIWVAKIEFLFILIATSIISLILPTPAPVPSIAAHPTSSYLLSSATYSGVLQIWDVRSPKQALFSVNRVPKEGKGERVLCVDWDGERMVAGGEDGEVGLWTARGQ
jgi:ribosome biogenesis protein